MNYLLLLDTVKTNSSITRMFFTIFFLFFKILQIFSDRSFKGCPANTDKVTVSKNFGRLSVRLYGSQHNYLLIQIDWCLKRQEFWYHKI
ncbi:hypothetical protein BpHYR1_040304 [Brachionus plicatilis]|uniref:Uncharacterized protein n=1 Tax=Brachionus plicatilis TaxID=10195 RepID=A0A3M7PKC4_BRAPC|nr:hypothetical protein BpHYR1_040304 [Brachionus plicatilis]